MGMNTGRGRRIRRLRRYNYRGLLGGASSGRGNAAALALSQKDEALKERDRFKDGLLRSRAELENFRRRAERERKEADLRAGEGVLHAVLPILDNFSRAIDGSQKATDAKVVRDGVEMIRDQLRAALVSSGLEPIDAMGKPFDPLFHEAVGVEERDDVEENQVIDVLQEGFMLRGRLLRAAMVRVSKRG